MEKKTKKLQTEKVGFFLHKRGIKPQIEKALGYIQAGYIQENHA